MLTITASVAGQNYQATWDPDFEADEDLAAVLAWAADSGETVMVTPTGPLVPVSTEDPRSVLAYLEQDAEAVTVEGEMPPWPYPDWAGPRAIY